MGIFTFLFYLGIINIIFGFLWKWIFVLPAALIVTFLRIDVIGMRVVKVFGSYLLVSLSAMLTLAALGENPGALALFFYPILTGFIVYMSYITNSYEARKEAAQSGDIGMIERLNKDANFEAYLSIGSVVFFFIFLFVPEIINNSLINGAMELVFWIYDIPVLGFLIGIGGIITVAGILFQGIISFGIIGAALFNKKETTQEPYEESEHKITDAEVIETKE